MQDVDQHCAVLPTGSWLIKQRLQLGLTRAQLARAVQSHSASLRSIEEHNRVIPPGWYPALRSLGMQVQEPVWPALMPTYYGTALNRDLRTCASLQNSRFWLGRQLYVPESEVSAVIRGNLPVPSSWLLKLAELGANVPAQVRMALNSIVSEVGANIPAGTLEQATVPFRGEFSDAARISNTVASSPIQTRSSPFFNTATASADPSPKAKTARVPTTPVEENRSQACHGHEFRSQATAAGPHAERQASAGRIDPTGATGGIETPTSAPKMRERFSIFFHLSEDSGAHFSVSAPFLKKVCRWATLGITDWISAAAANPGSSARANSAHLQNVGAPANRSG